MAKIDITLNDNGASKIIDKVAASADEAAKNVEKVTSNVDKLQQTSARGIDLKVSGNFETLSDFVDTFKNKVDEISKTEIKINYDSHSIEEYKKEVQDFVKELKEFQKLKQEKNTDNTSTKNKKNLNDTSSKLRTTGRSLYNQNPETFNEIYNKSFSKIKSSNGFIQDSVSGFLSSGITDAEKKYFESLNTLFSTVSKLIGELNSELSQVVQTQAKSPKSATKKESATQVVNDSDNKSGKTTKSSTDRNESNIDKKSQKSQEELVRNTEKIAEVLSKPSKLGDLPDGTLQDVLKGLKEIPDANSIIDMDPKDRSAWIRFIEASGNLVHALDGVNREGIKTQEIELEKDKLAFRQLKNVLSTGSTDNNKKNSLSSELASIYTSGMGISSISPSLIGGRFFGAGMRSIKQKSEERQIEEILAERSDTYKNWKEENKGKEFFKEADSTVKGKAIGEIQDFLNESPKVLAKISKAGTGAINTLGLLTTAVTALGKMAYKTGKESIAAYQEIEGLQTQLSVVYGSQTQSQEAFNAIEQYAKKSPFGVETMTQQAILLKQSGVGSSELMDVMGRIGDLASGNAEKMKSISDVYARVLSSTTVTARDMRQLAIAGIPAYEALSKATKETGANEGYGYNKNEIRSALQAGKITSEDFKEMVKVLTGEGGAFEGAVERGSKTLKARQQNLSDMREMALSEIGETLVKLGGNDVQDSIYGTLLNIKETFWTWVEEWRKEKNEESDYSSAKNKLEGMASMANSMDPVLQGIFAKTSFMSEGERKEYQRQLYSAGYQIYQDAEQKFNNDSVISDKEVNYLKAYETFLKVRKSNPHAYEEGYEVVDTSTIDGYRGYDFYDHGMSMTEDEIKGALSEIKQMLKSDIFKLNPFKGEDKRNAEYMKTMDSHLIENVSAQMEKQQAQAHDDAQGIIDAIGDSAKQVGAVSKRSDWKKEWDAGVIQTQITGDKNWRDDIAFGNKILSEGRQTQVLDEKGNIIGYDMSKMGGFEKYLEAQTDLLSDFRDLTLSIPDMFDLVTGKQLNGDIKEELDIYKQNLEQWFTTLISDDEWEANLRTEQGERLKKLVESMLIIMSDTNKVDLDMYKQFLLMKNNLPTLLQNTVGQGKDLSKFSPTQLKRYKEALKAFDNTSLEITYDTSGAEKAGARTTPPLWAQILGSATGIDNTRVLRMGGGEAMGRYYRDNISKRNMFNTVASSLLSAGVNLGKISEKMVRTGTGYQGTQLFDWNKSMKSIEEMASQKSIATQQALIQAYQEQIDTLNNLETAGVATLDQWNDLHDASQILGTGFSLAAEKLADGSYRFTEATIRTAEEMKKAYNAKIIQEQITLTFREAINSLQQDTLKTQISESVLRNLFDTGSYIRLDQIDHIADTISGLVQTIDDRGATGLTDAINKMSVKDRDSIVSSLNEAYNHLKGVDLLSTERVSGSAGRFVKATQAAPDDPYYRATMEALNGSWRTSSTGSRTVTKNLTQEELRPLINEFMSKLSASEQSVMRNEFYTSAGSLKDISELLVAARKHGITTTKTVRESTSSRVFDSDLAVQNLANMWNELNRGIAGFSELSKDEFWTKYMSKDSPDRLFSFNRDGSLNFYGTYEEGRSASTRVKAAEGITDESVDFITKNLFKLPETMRASVLNGFASISGDGYKLKDLYHAVEENTAAVRELDYYKEVKGIMEHLDDFTIKNFVKSLSNVSPLSDSYNPYQLQSTKSLLKGLGIDENYDVRAAFKELARTSYTDIKASRVLKNEDGSEFTREQIYNKNQPFFDIFATYGKENGSIKENLIGDYVNKFKRDIWLDVYGKYGKEIIPKKLEQATVDLGAGVYSFARGSGNVLSSGAGYLGSLLANQEELNDVISLLEKDELGNITKESLENAKSYYASKYRMEDYMDMAYKIMFGDIDPSKMTREESGMYEYIKDLLQYTEGGVVTGESQNAVYNAIQHGFASSDLNHDPTLSRFNAALESYAFGAENLGKAENWMSFSSDSFVSAYENAKDAVLEPIDKTNELFDRLLNEGFSEIDELLKSGSKEDVVQAYEKLEELLKNEELLDFLGMNTEDAEALLDKFNEGLVTTTANAEALSKAMSEFGSVAFDALTQMPVTMFSDFTVKLGEEWYQIAEHGKEWADSCEEIHRAMVKIIADTMSNISGAAINTGLNIAGQAALTGNWGMVAAGLGLAAAGGFGNVFSSYLSSWAEDNDSADDEADRLERLKNNLADLLEQARNDATYYEVTLRNKSALASNDYVSARSVNDMIITPQGKFSTAPDDFIMAMKDPKSLSRSAGGTAFCPNINFSVVNESGQVLGVTSTSQKMADNGDLDIIATVNAMVANAIAKGEYDAAFDTLKARKQGNVVSA